MKLDILYIANFIKSSAFFFLVFFAIGMAFNFE